MPNSKLISRSLVHALGVLVYVAAVAWIMTNGDRLFSGPMAESIFGPISFLLLFVLSAAVVGLLVFAKPAMMYFDGQKKEAVKLVLYTVIWLAVITVLAMVMMFSRS